MPSIVLVVSTLLRKLDYMSPPALLGLNAPMVLSLSFSTITTQSPAAQVSNRGILWALLPFACHSILSRENLSRGPQQVCCLMAGIWMMAFFVVILMIWLKPSRLLKSLVFLLTSSLTSPNVFPISLPQVIFPTSFPPLLLLLLKGLCSWVPLLILLTTVHQLSRK